MTRRTAGRGLALVVSACSLAACDDYTQPVSLGTLERDRIELAADSGEPIERILVREGDIVEAGAILVQQDTTRAEIALNKARADEAAARSSLLEAESGPRAQQISQARARLQAATSAAKTAEFELNRDLQLIDRNLVSRNRVDLAQGRYDEAVARREEARAALDEFLEGTRSEAIDQARARHAAALATVEDLQVTLTRASIRAPVSGVIESLPFKLGERPRVGATAAVLLADGRTYARVHVSEPLRAQLTPGAPALIAMDNRAPPLEGRLRWISADAAFTPYFALNQHDRARLSYLAEVDVVNDNPGLPIGVPVEVSFPGLTQ